MKKVININFQGRVIPIEESAYDMLKKYVESLRIFFANEEGRDEIINDIEGRIAELFSEILKKGNSCIVEADVQTVITSMGRPEDFDAEEGNLKSQLSGENNRKEKTYSHTYNSAGTKKLFRDENQKVMGGVCAGIANYFGIDPLIVRILFVVFIGITFWVYFILWIAIPGSSSMVIGSQRKRLFRDPDNKLFAGVCSGLAQYFAAQVWIPRVLFLIPFFSFVFHWGNWGWWNFPNFLSFSFSPGSLVIYIIFWLVLPEAKSSADKLEMKGEKVDLNNIKSTIQGDMEGFKDRAKVFGNELKEKAQEFGENLSRSTNRAANEAGNIAKAHSSGIGRVLATIVKIFAYFILGFILFIIVMSLFSLGTLSTGLLAVTYPYVFASNLERFLAWGTLIFFIWIPVIATVTWVIRRLTRKKKNSGLISLIFSGLWILGWIFMINLIVQIVSDFRYRNNPVEQNITLTNPSVSKLEVNRNVSEKYYTGDWFKLEPFASFDEDSLHIRNIWIRIIKSDNDSFKVTEVKLANSSSKAEANKNAERIKFSITQNDTMLLLDQGLKLNKEEKFRNQRVIVTIAVPVGKRIFIHDKVGWSDDVSVNFGSHNNYWDWENNEDSKAYDWEHNVDYVMTATGLKKLYNNKDEDDDTDNADEDKSENNDENKNSIEQFRKSKEQLQKEKDQKTKEIEELNKELEAPVDSTRYHYNTPPVKPAATEDKRNKATAKKMKRDNVPNGINDTALLRYAL